jgi:hypothetical protein
MKKKHLFPKTAWAALVLALAFTACPNLNDGGGGDPANKDALTAAIANAEAAKPGIKTDTDAQNVPLGTQWVTQAELNALDTAISNATGVKNNSSANQSQVDSAVSVLNSAIAAFINARKAGSATPVDRSALDAQIAGAESAINGVISAADAAGAAQGANWATPAQLDAINAAITTARNATTQTEVNTALTTLQNALNTFNNQVSGNPPGTKAADFTQAEMDDLIEKANTAKAGAVAAANGDDVPLTAFWVSEADLGALNNAINAAGTLSDSNYLALLNALKAFDEAKTPGSLPEKTPLFDAIMSADTARAGVNIAAKKEEAPKGSAWVTQAQWDALNTAYTAAVNTAGNAGATKKAVADAAAALNTAITVFNTAKAGNGLGTAANGITISGLGAIYKNGTKVYVGVADSKEIDPSSDSDNFVPGTVTNGSLTVPLDVKNGSYYIGFSSDGFIYFISKTTAVFSGAAVGKAYNDFELYTWSMNMGDMGLPSSMTLNAVIQAMSEGEVNNYAGFKTFMRQMISEELGDEYANLNFLDVAFYKNEACTQEFSGGDTVGPTTVIYTKVPFFQMMSGGETPVEQVPVEAVGYINGTVTLTGYSGQRPQVEIYAYYYGQYTGGGPVDGSGRDYTVNSDGSFSIPFTEGFLNALQSGAQDLRFSLWIGSGSSGFSKTIEPPIPVTSSQLSGGNLNVGSLGTVNLASITLNGTITVTHNGQRVPNVSISAYGPGGGGSTNLKSPGSNAAWSITLSPYDSPTDLSLYVSGYDSDWDNLLFEKEAGITIPGVYNTSVTGLTINLGDISTTTLSGTIDVTIDGQKPEYVYIAAGEVGEDDYWLGKISIGDYDTSPNTWSITFETLPPGTQVHFVIQWTEKNTGFTGNEYLTAPVITMPYNGTPIALTYHGSNSDFPSGQFDPQASGE